MVDIEIIDHVKAVHDFCEKQTACYKCPLESVCCSDAPEYWYIDKLAIAERKLINENNI